MRKIIKTTLNEFLLEQQNVSNVFDMKNPNYLDAWLNVGDEDMDSYYEYGVGGEYPTIQMIIEEVKNLKFPLRIYRGISTSDKNPNILTEPHSVIGENISWTTSRYVAEGFGSLVYTGIVESADDIDLEYTIQRRIMHKPINEKEIIMKNNNLIKNIEIFKK
jgi:hypothetical protein